MAEAEALRAAPVDRPAQTDGAAPADRHAIVIGAGLAGAAACERLAARGWNVTLIEQCASAAQQASGNLAGIFMPLLAQDDNPTVRLARAALPFALARWRALGGLGERLTGAQCGVLQLARDARHAEAQRRIAQSGRWPESEACWLESGAASELLGATAPHGAWLFGQGGWAHPAAVCAAMLEACGQRLTRVFSRAVPAIRREEGQWQALDTEGGVIAAAPVLILANGTGAINLAQAASLPLAAVRGQVTHLAEGVLPSPPSGLVLCREAYVTPASNGVVCVGATYDDDADPALREDSQRQNLARVADMLGVAAPVAPLAGRTGFRCVAPDRLPLVGALPDDSVTARAGGGPIERLRDVARHPGLYGLLGYASRGLTWAPLMAELLACQLEHQAAPLDAKLVAALDPARFLLKRLRRL